MWQMTQFDFTSLIRILNQIQVLSTIKKILKMWIFLYLLNIYAYGKILKREFPQLKTKILINSINRWNFFWDDDARLRQPVNNEGATTFSFGIQTPPKRQAAHKYYYK